jgi:hypothetical protein
VLRETSFQTYRIHIHACVRDQFSSPDRIPCYLVMKLRFINFRSGPSSALQSILRRIWTTFLSNVIAVVTEKYFQVHGRMETRSYFGPFTICNIVITCCRPQINNPLRGPQKLFLPRRNICAMVFGILDGNPRNSKNFTYSNIQIKN